MKHTLTLLTFLLLFAIAAASVSCQGGNNGNSVVILNGGGKKPKILALHGGGGDAAEFSRQQGVRDLAAALPQYEFVFAHAPEAGGLWIRAPKSKAEPTTDPNWATNSISYLDRFIAEHGPFYGLVAYSQGCEMALVNLAHTPANTFQKIALFNGYAPTTHHGLLARIDRVAPFATSTLVFLGEKL